MLGAGTKQEQVASGRAFAWAADGPLLALLFLAPLVLGGTDRGPLLAAWILLGAGWLAHLYHALFFAREIRWPRTHVNSALVVLLLAVLAASIATVSAHATAIEVSRLTWGALAFWLLASRPGDAVRRRTYVIAPLAGAAVAGWLGYRHYLITRPIEAGWREFGTFTNPNFMAGYLAMALPIALANLADRWHRWAPVIWGLLAALLLVALALTGSRGGWLSFAVAVVVLALLVARSTTRPRLWSGALLVGVAVVLVPGLAAPPVRGRIAASFGPQSHSHMFRVLTWRGTVNMIRHHPWLGTGPGTFRLAYRQYAVAGYTVHAHENYLQIAAENGAVAGLAFVGLIAAALVTAGTAFRRLTDRHQRAITAAAVAGIVAFAVHGAFDSTWYINAAMLAFWWLPGLALIMMRGVDPSLDRVRPLQVSSGARAIIAVVAAGLLAALIAPVARAAIAERRLAAAQAALHQGELPAALALARAAADVDPGNADAYRRQAGILAARPASLPQAVRIVERAARLEPTNPENQRMLASLYHLLEDAGGEQEHLLQAIRLSPNDVEAHLALADLLRAQGDDFEARRQYREIVTIQRSPYGRYPAIPERVETAYAFAHYQLGRYALDGARGIPAAGPWTATSAFNAALRVLREHDRAVRARLERVLRYHLTPTERRHVLDEVVTNDGPRWDILFARLNEIDPQLADPFRTLVGYRRDQEKRLHDLRESVYESLITAYTQRNEPELAARYRRRLEALKDVAPATEPVDPRSPYHAD